MPRSPQRWTPQEDRVLLEKAKQLSSDGKKTDTAISWTSVSSALANRNNKDCRKRWCKLIGATKGPWTLSEDERLLEGVQKYGSQWAPVAKTVKTRNSDQCAKRWQHCLDPSLDRSEWTNEKDAQLITAVKIYGTNWKDIKKFEFPMRSTTNLKNRHIALSRQSNKRHSIHTNETGTLEPSIEWLSIEREMSDNMMIERSDDDDEDYFENDYNESSHSSALTSPFQNNHTLDCNVSGSLATDTTPTSANSGHYYFPLDWELSSHQELGLIANANPNCQPLENFHESTFSHATDIESAICRVASDCEPYISEFPTLSMPSPRSQQANINALHNARCTRSREGLTQDSSKLLQNVTSDILSSMPQMTLTIDNPDLQTMTGILEVLTKAKSKVTISMNT